MRWRETYRGRSDQTAFMDRLGCFSIIGEDGPYGSEQLRGFVVYMPPRLYYPWHAHPAEEAYLVISGTAAFRREGHVAERLSEGQVMMHTTDQAHAIETFDEPMLSLVVWRNHLSIAPHLVQPPLPQIQRSVA